MKSLARLMLIAMLPPVSVCTAQQPIITSPSSGTVVAPGQTITVTVLYLEVRSWLCR
jgi:hypothetical protein